MQSKAEERAELRSIEEETQCGRVNQAWCLSEAECTCQLDDSASERQELRAVQHKDEHVIVLHT